MANDSNSSYITDDFDASNISVSEPISSPEYNEENTADLSVDSRINITNHSELDESGMLSKLIYLFYLFLTALCRFYI